MKENCCNKGLGLISVILICILVFTIMNKSKRADSNQVTSCSLKSASGKRLVFILTHKKREEIKNQIGHYANAQTGELSFSQNGEHFSGHCKVNDFEVINIQPIVVF